MVMSWLHRRRSRSSDRLVVSWSNGILAYVLARVDADGQWAVSRLGVERREADTGDAFAARLQAQQLSSGGVHAVLRAEQYQLLQIPTPAVPQEEWRAAARYQVRDMVDQPLDELVLDVMQVGDGKQSEKAVGSLFVVVASNAVVREVSVLAQEQRWPLSVVEVEDTAIRNLQIALARRYGLGNAACALLTRVSERQALLTMVANGELFYSRRLDLQESFDSLFSEQPEPAAPVPESSFVPVVEYVPSHTGDSSFGDLGYYGTAAGSGGQDPRQRLLVEVQRSLDLWDRTWTALPLAGFFVHAGDRSGEVAAWLGRETGHAVQVADFHATYPALSGLTLQDQQLCLPLLGALLRDPEPAT